jgi:phage terminase small subunit
MAELKAPKREMFCREYIKDLNGTQSAIRAGYSEKTANRIASQLLSKLDVQSRIAEMQSVRVEEVRIDANYVLKRLIEIDEMDVADILDDGGDFLPIRKWPKVWRTTLSGLDIAIINSGDTETILKKIKWPDKVKNLELLGKHIGVGAFTEKVDHTSSDGSMSPAKPTRAEILEAQKVIGVELDGLD